LAVRQKTDGNDSTGQQHTFQDLSASAHCGIGHANSRARFPRVRKLIDRYTDLEWLKAHPSRKSIAALRQANTVGAVTGHQPHPDILAMSRSKLTPADIGH